MHLTQKKETVRPAGMNFLQQQQKLHQEIKKLISAEP
jgi:hypothetical protein